MKVENIDIEATIAKVQALVREDKELSAATKSMFEILILIITLLANRLNLNSTNSSKPPSSDPHRKKRPKKTGKKAGGQKGHAGITLKQVDEPDIVEIIDIDRRKLPAGKYRQVGFERRQVFDIDISRIVTEYRAEILEDENGKRFVASFPETVTKAVQYGTGAKAQAVYMSQFQLIPYDRIRDYFADQLHLPVSAGSIFNFNQEAFERLAEFENRVKAELASADVAHADETGINIGGKGLWLHCMSNDDWTFYGAHEKRGAIAMNDMGILPLFKGTLCHDHWKPYYTYDCTHALCNAHHLRELKAVHEIDGEEWAGWMVVLLCWMRKVTQSHIIEGTKPEFESENMLMRLYDQILEQGQLYHQILPPLKSKTRRKSSTRLCVERMMVSYSWSVVPANH